MKLTYTMQSLSISAETRGNYLLTVRGLNGVYAYDIRRQATAETVVSSKPYKRLAACQKAGRAALDRLASS